MIIIVLAPRQALCEFVVEGQKERARTMLMECNNVRPVCLRTEQGVGKGEEGPAESITDLQ